MKNFFHRLRIHVFRQKRIITVFAVLLVTLAVENLRKHSEAVFSAEVMYGHIVTRGFRAAIPRFTTLVEISEIREPPDVLQTNVCAQRGFMARLLEAVESARPAVVVIDKHFSKGACKPGETNTIQLQTAVRRLMDNNIPVVVGLYFPNENNAVIPAPLGFPPSARGRPVSEGDIRLDDDVRRVPLAWNEPTQNGGAADVDTLSLKAALAHSAKLLQLDRRLLRFYEDGDAPFASLLPPDAYVQFRMAALDVICGHGVSSDVDWRTCSAASQETLDQLRGRVVLIGEDNRADRHSTPSGVISGVTLQAMYVEAILDGELFVASRVLDITVGVLVLAIFSIIVAKSGPAWRFVWVITLLGAVYLLAAALVKWGLYLDWSIGVFLFVLFWGELLLLLHERTRSAASRG